MKKAVIILLTVFATTGLVAIPAFAEPEENSWVSLTEMPTGRGYLEAAVVNGKIYAIGGSGPIGVNEEYDPATNNWTTKAPMPIPQQSFAIAVYGGKVYCFGGEGNGTANQVYDPAMDTWQIKSSLPTERYGLQAQVVDNEIFVIGGVKGIGYNLGVEELNVTEAYSPLTDTWTTKATIPNPSGRVSAVIDNKICVIGSNSTQIYDPVTDSWNICAPFNASRGMGIGTCCAAATTGIMAPKRIYLYYDSTLQVYNPYTDSWTTGAPPPTNNRGDAAIAVVDDQLYLIGGFQLTEWWQFIDYAANERYTPFGYGTPQSTPTPVPSMWQADSFSSVQVALLCGAAAAVAAVVGVAAYLRKHRR